jgi:hypothetical protein
MYGTRSYHDLSFRPAFKRTELILVIAIGTLLLMILLPLLHKTRDDDQVRMSCWNNLKQLAVASQNYHDIFRHYPPGTIVGSDMDPLQRFGCLTELLPFLEQQAIFNRLDLKQGWQAPSNKEVVSAPVKVFICMAGYQPGKERFHPSSYVGIAGAGEDAASLPITDARCGIFGYDRIVRVNDIEDGTGNTLLFLETRRDAGPWAAGGPATVRGIDTDDELPIGQDCAFGLHFGGKRWLVGRRKIGATAAVADGSVRQVWDGTSAEVLAALATIAGGDNEGLRIDW